MLAEEVLFVEHFRDGAGLGIGGQGLQSHRGDLFQEDGVVSGLRFSLACHGPFGRPLFQTRPFPGAK